MERDPNSAEGMKIGGLEVIRANPDNLGELMSVLVEASRWLESRGIRQWPAEHLLAKSTVGWIQERCMNGESYLVMEGEEVAATFTLIPRLTYRDQKLWGDKQDDAVYLHALAVRRRFSGRRIGRGIIALSEEVGLRLRKGFVRLDCWKLNPVLVAYYEAQGFVSRGERDSGIPGYEAMILEKSITPR